LYPIDGATKVVGIIGWPVEHSLSPPMQNAAYAEMGVNWRYLPFPVRPGEAGAAVQGVRALGLAGANVTIPHKEAVIPFLDEMTPAARAVGAVNTIIVDDLRLLGDNTDVLGFLGALDLAGVTLDEHTQALVLGAGGAARAAAYGLLERGVEVVIHARTRRRAERLVADMRQAVSGSRLSIADVLPTDPTLIVNCTPVGMWPHEDGSPLPAGYPLRPGVAVMDMVYRPLETRLLQQAKAAGALAIDGLEMLIQGGAASSERWTGKKPPLDVMRRTCRKILKTGETHTG